MLKVCFNAFLFCFFILMLSACGTSRLPVTDKLYHEPVNYTVIYLIHADANYLYHNQQGEPLQADIKVLNEAKQAGRNAESGEVFIFHLKPETKILYLFPRKDRRFLYYRNGELIYEKSYSPHSKKQPFLTEASLYQHFHRSVESDNAYKKVMLYFGHQVPSNEGTRYFRSRSEAQFNTALFAKGLQGFLQSKGSEFDLTVLSTCDNGSPLMVHALAPVTDFLLASPQNLHLSHIDTKALRLLENNGEVSTERLAVKIATDTFKRLSSFLQTVISLSLYNINEMKSYLPRMAARYQSYLNEREGFTPSGKNVDCSSLPFFTKKQAAKGVEIWYKAPQFGRMAGSENFSGWGCKQY